MKAINLIKEELKNTLESIEINENKYNDEDDAINLGWVEGIRYALNVIDMKVAVVKIGEKK